MKAREIASVQNNITDLNFIQDFSLYIPSYRAVLLYILDYTKQK